MFTDTILIPVSKPSESNRRDVNIVSDIKESGARRVMKVPRVRGK